MEHKKKIFTERSYEKLKEALQEIAAEEDIKDVYVLSFKYELENEDMRYPMLTLGYNTLSNAKEESYNAPSKEEAKWDFTYWLHSEEATVGGSGDALLKEWFAKTPYYYTEEDNDKAMEDDEDLYDKILKKGDKFDKEFIKEMQAWAKRLFEEKVIEATFGRNIPIVIHEAEAETTPISWTKKTNPSQLIKEYLEYWDSEEE